MTETSPYPHLFSPIQIGPHTLPNRVLMGSMHTNLEERGSEGLERLAAFYAERARGSVALMVTGGFAPNEEGRLGGEGGCLVESDGDSHQVVTEAVHKEGSRILLQLLHSGRYGYHTDIVAPSPIRSPINRCYENRSRNKRFGMFLSPAPMRFAIARRRPERHAV